MSLDDKSSYYDVGGIETLEIIRAKLTAEEYRGFLKGNVLKYICRSSHKGDDRRDVEKATHYANWLQEADEQDATQHDIDV